MARLLHYLVGLSLFLAVLTGESVFAQSRERYFPETGHRVTGEFLVAYLRAVNPEMVFGYPITPAFLERSSGLVVQYFQRARFELHPELNGPLRVKLSDLGKYLYKPALPAVIEYGKGKCKRFSDVEFEVCGTFLDFFEAHGGVTQFGFPISDYEIQLGRTVQYFQKARLEWHPENPAGQRVVLGDLGSEYFRLLGENTLLLRGSNTIQEIVGLKARAFPRQSVTTFQGEQEIKVVVLDQNNQPVLGARVEVKVRLPDGSERLFDDLTPTNRHGLTSLGFKFLTPMYGIAQVTVQVSYNEMNTSTITSFRVWW